MFDHPCRPRDNRERSGRPWALEILLYPGFQALTLHRLSHRLWRHALKLPAGWSQVAKLDGVETTRAPIGHGVFTTTAWVS